MAEKTDIPWGCGVMRYEAEGYENTIDWLWNQPQALVDAICDRAPQPHDGWYDLMAALDTYAHDECELDAGHTGPHDFPETWPDGPQCPDCAHRDCEAVQEAEAAFQRDLAIQTVGGN